MRAQSSIEFVILVSAVLFFFIAFLVFFQGNMNDSFEKERDNAVRDIALTIQDEARLASEASNGYSRTFNLPLQARDKNYSANIVEESIYVKTVDNKHAISFPVGNVTGNIIPGDNLIMNRNGFVILNP